MPELPDLEVFSHNLNEKLAGKKIKTVTVHTAAKKLNVPAAELKKLLEHQTFKKVYREGKELYFSFKDDTVLALHLMLRGQLHLEKGDKKHKGVLLELELEDGQVFSLSDYQGMAAIKLNPEEPGAPDALAKEVNIGFLKEKLASTKSSIKNFLLDQHNLRGIGNAYADEILWDARISPFSICSKIPEDKVHDLLHSIKSVLQHAEKEIKRLHPNLISGEIRDFLQIHNPNLTHSPDGATIHKKTVGARKTYYTDEQELYK